jgi:uncharacterized protein YajQ (UPF0234 family)
MYDISKELNKLRFEFRGLKCNVEHYDDITTTYRKSYLEICETYIKEIRSKIIKERIEKSVYRKSYLEDWEQEYMPFPSINKDQGELDEKRKKIVAALKGGPANRDKTRKEKKECYNNIPNFGIF